MAVDPEEPTPNVIAAADGEEDEIEQDDGADFDDLLGELKKRADAAKIAVEITDNEVLGRSVKVHLPAGRGTEAILLYSAERVRRLLRVPFEDIVVLGGFSAFASYKHGLIEAAVSILGNVGVSKLVFQRIAQVPKGERGFSKPLPTTSLEGAGGKRIVMGPPSGTLQTVFGVVGGSRPSIRIEGLSISRHDEAVALLESVANSVFFEIELIHDVALGLRRRRQFRTRRVAKPSDRESGLAFPRTEFDRDAASLYWYARAAFGMPLLQYLAYYQTIEFYFPTYSQAEAQRKVRNIIKSPAFRPDRDVDLARILTVVRGAGRGYGDERSQLRATIQECVDASLLRAFIEEEPERALFLQSKTAGLTDVKVSVARADADLRSEVADRIYDIRCRIVHTKAASEEVKSEVLLPYSKEADMLLSDIELIQFVARQVLVAGSSTLVL